MTGMLDYISGHHCRRRTVKTFESYKEAMIRSSVSCHRDWDNVKTGRRTCVALPKWQPGDEPLPCYLRILLLSNLKSPVRLSPFLILF